MMSAKNKLLFLSASERWNLGDLLFPIVFDHYTSLYRRNFTNVGLADYDPKDAVAIPVERIQKHLDEQNVTLIVGGGEVLGANLATLAMFLDRDQKFRKPFRFSLGALEMLTSSRSNPGKVQSLLLHRIKKGVAKRMQREFRLPSDTVLPFYVAVMPHARRFYLPVGGHFPELSNQILEQSANHTIAAAGRDERTADSFPNQMHAKLVPDPVSTICQIFPEPEAKVKRVIVQLSMHKMPFGLTRLQHLLEEFIRQGYEVMGLAIGRCRGHQDKPSLESLAQILPAIQTNFSSSIQESVKLLAESEVYVGTSLHGAILSHAYGNAVIAMDEHVPKLENYLNTWMGEHALHFTHCTKDRAIFQFIHHFREDLAKANATRLAVRSEAYINSILEQA